MRLDPYMTDPKLAAAILRWANAGNHPCVNATTGAPRTDLKFLEPSAGEGAFAIPLARVPGIDVTAVELHGGRATMLRRAFADVPDTTSGAPVPSGLVGMMMPGEPVRLAKRQVVCRDFVAWAEERAEANPSDLFDLTIGNPPYAEEQDCDHVAAMLTLSWRVVVLLRLNFLAGGGRAEAIFRNALLRRLVVLTSRPTFIDRNDDEDARVSGSPRHEFGVFELIPRGALTRADADPDGRRQSIEFWNSAYERIA